MIVGQPGDSNKIQIEDYSNNEAQRMNTADSSTTPLATVHHYHLRYSRTVLGIEIALQILVLICLVNSVPLPWLVVFVALLLLLAVHYFQHSSIIHAFPSGSRIELRDTPPTLIWYDAEQSREIPWNRCKIYRTRWFLLLQLDRGAAACHKLLLADSFEDNYHYTRFRRQSIEMNLC